jgi:hypothetical protein
LLHGLSLIYDGHVGNPESGRADMNPNRRCDTHFPLFRVQEAEANSGLPGSMIVLSQWAFLNFAIDIFGVGLVLRM